MDDDLNLATYQTPTIPEPIVSDTVEPAMGFSGPPATAPADRMPAGDAEVDEFEAAALDGDSGLADATEGDYVLTDGTEGDFVTVESLSAPTETLPAEPPPDPEEAAAADAELDRLIGIVREPLARLAVLIHRIREKKLYMALGHETFEAYIGGKQLQFSRSFVFQLAKVGKMLDSVGIDPITLPEENLEITKMAQIARLPDAGEQRHILESGVFDSGDEPRHLSDIPVRELSTLVDQRLGKEPRQPKPVRSLSETYDDSQMPWEGRNQFDQDSTPVVAHEFTRELRIPESDSSDWRRLVDDLGSAIRPLSGPERDDAINALSKLYQELVSY